MSASESRGGVVFRVDGQLSFLPASIAIKVLPVPEMARVPGGPPELRGVALVEGNMIPVVDVSEKPGVSGSSPERAMLLCLAFGERIGLVGIDVVATGLFDAAEAAGAVCVHGAAKESAPVFDVGRVIARVRQGRWAV